MTTVATLSYCVLILAIQASLLVSSWDLKPSAEKYWHMKKSAAYGKDNVHHQLDLGERRTTFNGPTHYADNFNGPTHYADNYFDGHQEMSIEPRSAVLQARSPAGCTYKGRKYAHKEEVTTSQPCLNCTCQVGFVSCFLRVCPTLTAPYNDDSCYLLKEPGSCCSTMKCMGLSSDSSSGSSGSKRQQPLPVNANSIERKSEASQPPPRTVGQSPSYAQSTRRPSYWSSSRPVSSSTIVTPRPLQARPRPSTARPRPSVTASRPSSSYRPTSPTTTFGRGTSTTVRTTLASSVSTASGWPSAAGTTIMASARYPTNPRPQTQYPSTAHTQYPSMAHTTYPVSAHRQPARQQPHREEDFFRMSALLV